MNAVCKMGSSLNCGEVSKIIIKNRDLKKLYFLAGFFYIGIFRFRVFYCRDFENQDFFVIEILLSQDFLLS